MVRLVIEMTNLEFEILEQTRRALMLKADWRTFINDCVYGEAIRKLGKNNWANVINESVKVTRDKNQAETEQKTKNIIKGGK